MSVTTRPAATDDGLLQTRPPAHKLLVPGLIFACLVAAIVSSLGAPLIPTIARTDHVTLATAQWSLTITLLVGVVATPTMGRLGDGPYRRQVILGGLGVVLIGGLLAAASTGFALLVVGRGLQGIGLGLTPLAIATARDALSVDRARPAVSLLSITTVTGVGLGYPITGLVAEAGGMHVAYYFGCAVTALALIGAFIVVPSTSHLPRLRLDYLGAVGLGIALACLLLAISQGESWGWGSSRVIGLAIVAVVLVAAWIWWELRCDHPLVALRLVRQRTVFTADLVAVLAGVGMYMLLSSVTRLVQTPTNTGYGLGVSIVVAGLALVPFSIGSFLATRLAPLLIRRSSPSLMLPLGAVALLIGMAGFATARGSLWEILIEMALAGLGVGLIFAVMPGFVMRSVPAEETGSAMSFNQLLRYVGYTIGSALSAVILEVHTASGHTYPSTSGYAAIGLLGCVMWAITGVVSWVLPHRAATHTAAQVEAEIGLAEEVELAEESVVSGVPDDELAAPRGATPGLNAR